MFIKKKKNVPKEHSRINAISIEDYNKKISDLISIIDENKEHYNYIKFNSEYKKEKESDSHSLLFINNNNKFLNLKEFESIFSLIKIYVTTNKLIKKQNQSEFNHFLFYFLKDLYPIINFKNSYNNKIEINDILLMIKDYDNIIKEANCFLNKAIIPEDSIAFYKKMFKEYELNKILTDLENIELNITHENFSPSQVLFSYFPIILEPLDDFYKKVFFEATVKNQMTNLLGARLDEVDSKFSSKPVFNPVQLRNRLFIIFDEIPDEDLLNSFLYSQMRALGIKLIFPNIKNEFNKINIDEKTKEFFIVNTKEIDF